MAASSSMSSQRLTGALKNLIRQTIGHVDFYAHYKAKVLSQSADNKTVDVQPDSPRLPKMSRIPLRLGVPGVEVKLSPGCYVMVGWDAGDPAKPYAWEPHGSVLKLTITVGSATFDMDATTGIVTLNGGTMPIARVGDTAGPYPITGGNPLILG